jgi:hypothetical protein
MVKMKHKGVRMSVETIISYRQKFMRYETAYSRLEGISDVIMNSVEMPHMDLVILHRLMQSWTSRQYPSSKKWWEKRKRDKIEILETEG